MVPSLCRMVLYRLSETDAQAINRRRTDGESIYNRSRAAMQSNRTWPEGAQAHIGNHVAVGEPFPMMIVKVWTASDGGAVNGQVFLDGCDVYWAQGVGEGDQPGQWSVPPRT